MSKDTGHSDPAEGARDVVERQLERQDKGEAETREPLTQRGKERETENQCGEPQ